MHVFVFMSLSSIINSRTSLSPTLHIFKKSLNEQANPIREAFVCVDLLRFCWLLSPKLCCCYTVKQTFETPTGTKCKRESWPLWTTENTENQGCRPLPQLPFHNICSMRLSNKTGGALVQLLDSVSKPRSWTSGRPPSAHVHVTVMMMMMMMMGHRIHLIPSLAPSFLHLRRNPVGLEGREENLEKSARVPEPSQSPAV